MSNPNHGKWYKFNDTIVEEFEMTEATLEAECFGGKYKAKVYDQGQSATNICLFVFSHRFSLIVTHHDLSTCLR